MARRAFKVTRKGQVTIPQELREKYDIHEGDAVQFQEDERGILIMRPEDVVTRNAGIFKNYPQDAEPFDRDRVWDEIVAERLGRLDDAS